MNSLQKEINKRDTQARDALGKGREDLARAALQNKAQLQQPVRRPDSPVHPRCRSRRRS